MNGIIFLDIDGTITVDLKPTPQPVIQYLHELVDQGWTLVFITGRTFHMGFEALRAFNFPYYYAFQNGAAILHMPEKRLIQKKYLPRDLLPKLEAICEGVRGDCIIYSGYESQDRCYYIPKHFDESLLTHLLQRSDVFKEEWQPIDSFASIPLSAFPVIKYFGDEASAITVCDRIKEQFGLDTSVIRDPYDPNFFLMQATASGINKGQALREIKQLTGIKGPSIAVGDDRNDYPMFEAADICVAMEDAPEILKQKAHIIAPEASKMGVITGLQLAIESIGG